MKTIHPLTFNRTCAFKIAFNEPFRFIINDVVINGIPPTLDVDDEEYFNTLEDQTFEAFMHASSEEGFKYASYKIDDLNVYHFTKEVPPLPEGTEVNATPRIGKVYRELNDIITRARVVYFSQLANYEYEVLQNIKGLRFVYRIGDNSVLEEQAAFGMKKLYQLYARFVNGVTSYMEFHDELYHDCCHDCPIKPKTTLKWYTAEIDGEEYIHFELNLNEKELSSFTAIATQRLIDETDKIDWFEFDNHSPYDDMDIETVKLIISSTDGIFPHLVEEYLNDYGLIYLEKTKEGELSLNGVKCLPTSTLLSMLNQLFIHEVALSTTEEN